MVMGCPGKEEVRTWSGLGIWSACCFEPRKLFPFWPWELSEYGPCSVGSIGIVETNVY